MFYRDKPMRKRPGTPWTPCKPVSPTAPSGPVATQVSYMHYGAHATAGRGDVNKARDFKRFVHKC